MSYTKELVLLLLLFCPLSGAIALIFRNHFETFNPIVVIRDCVKNLIKALKKSDNRKNYPF